MLEAVAQADGEALAEFLPAGIGAGVDDEIITADVIGDFFVELRFEPPDTAERMRGVVDACRMWRATEVVAGHATLFHPFDDFPLE